MLSVLRTSIRTHNVSRAIIGTVRNLLKRRANSDPTIEASSLATKKISEVIATMPKTNLLTYLNKVYT